MATVESKIWDHNGSYRLTIIESWPRTPATDQRVRRAARSADPMGLIQWTRIDDVTYDGTVLRFHVTSSRLDRMYR